MERGEWRKAGKNTSPDTKLKLENKGGSTSKEARGT